MKDFQVDDNLLDRLYRHAQNQEIARKEEDNKPDEHLENQLKSLIARSLWDFSAFVQIRMQMDEAYLRAIEIIENDTFSKMNIHYQ
jgi:carboxyl-terminal processing protease